MTGHELRCPSKLHGITREGVFEVKCASRFCGARPGVVVLHRFDLATAKLMETHVYRDPKVEATR